MTEDIEDLRFNLTEEMDQILIEVIMIKQVLEKKIKPDERKALEQELKTQSEKFIKLFRENNMKKLKEYKRLTNM